MSKVEVVAMAAFYGCLLGIGMSLLTGSVWPAVVSALLGYGAVGVAKVALGGDA